MLVLDLQDIQDYNGCIMEKTSDVSNILDGYFGNPEDSYAA